MKKAKLFALVMVICLVMSAFVSCNGPSKGLEFIPIRDGTCIVSSIGSCTDTKVVIPSVSPDGDRVIGIGQRAFSNCKSLTSITIPDSVTFINGEAFFGCSSLTSITIPGSVTDIWADAFSDCYSLKSIAVDESNTTYKSIDGNLYSKDGKTLIQYAIGKTDTSFTIPDSVTSISSYAFYRCHSLTSFTIPDSVTSISSYAFFGCSNLTSITIPNSVTSIGDSAFSSCNSLTSITIPNSVTSIGDSAFSGCSSLTSVTIGNSVTRISEYDFSDCSSLTSITIGNSVTRIGDYAFTGCESLETVYYTGSEEDWKKIIISYRADNHSLYDAEKIYNYVPEE